MTDADRLAREPWTWIQPRDTDDLVRRLLEASDLAVPERERENLCSCAHAAIKGLQLQLVARHSEYENARDQLERERDDAHADLAAERQARAAQEQAIIVCRDVLRFLHSVEWNDHSSEDHAHDLSDQLSRALLPGAGEQT